MGDGWGKKVRISNSIGRRNCLFKRNKLEWINEHQVPDKKDIRNLKSSNTFKQFISKKVKTAIEIRQYLEKNDNKLTTQENYGMQAECSWKSNLLP